VKIANLILATYFFLLSLAPNMQGFQFLNISSFVEHYEEHLDRNPSSTLISFVKEHYFNQLPMKTAVANTLVVFTCEFNAIRLSSIEEVHFSVKKEKFSTYKEGYFFDRNHSVWHPPQLC
jgi:hypothetical protein